MNSNLNVVTWGTREDPQKTDASKLPSQPEEPKTLWAEIKAKAFNWFVFTQNKTKGNVD